MPIDVIRPERETRTGWTRWIAPQKRGYLLACCSCGLVHELQFKTATEFRARTKPRLTAAYRKKTGGMQG